MPNRSKRSPRGKRSTMTQPRDDESRSTSRENHVGRERRSIEREGFTEDLINQEAAQLYERATAAKLCEEESEGSNESRGPSPPMHAGNRVDGLGLYRACSPPIATPMERFATVSPANEPFALLARNSMQSMELSIGSMETAPARISAAKEAVRHASDGDAQRQRQGQNDPQQQARGEKRSIGSNEDSRSPKRHQPGE